MSDDTSNNIGRSEILYSSRYGDGALPGHSMCRGECEGMGVVPVYMGKGDLRRQDPFLAISSCFGPDESDPHYIALWEAADLENPTSNGWHFVTCPTCNGTGKETK